MHAKRLIEVVAGKQTAAGVFVLLALNRRVAADGVVVQGNEQPRGEGCHRPRFRDISLHLMEECLCFGQMLSEFFLRKKKKIK